MKKYEVILFDWDGTLVDSMGLVLAGHNVVRRYFALDEWTLEDVFQKATKSARENFPILYGNRAEEAEKIFYDYVNQHRFNIINPLEGAEQALLYLKNQKILMGIVSNKKYEYLGIEIDHFKWADFFFTAVGAGEAAEDKPSALPIRLALSRLGRAVSDDKILYVGDTETDLLTAKNTGIDCAYVYGHKRDDALIKKYAPVWHGESVADMAKNLA